jgi:hypothetical protein
MGRHQRKGTEQKSTLTERDHRTLRGIVWKNHRNTAAEVIHLEGLASTKAVRRELTFAELPRKLTMPKAWFQQ